MGEAFEHRIPFIHPVLAEQDDIEGRQGLAGSLQTGLSGLAFIWQGQGAMAG